MGIEPTRSAWKADVLPLNYARRLGANRRLARSGRLAWESRRDETGSTVWRLVAGTGFEPVKALPSDLQSDPFGHSGIPPCAVAGARSSEAPALVPRHRRGTGGSGCPVRTRVAPDRSRVLVRERASRRSTTVRSRRDRPARRRRRAALPSHHWVVSLPWSASGGLRTLPALEPAVGLQPTTS